MSVAMSHCYCAAAYTDVESGISELKGVHAHKHEGLPSALLAA